MDKKSLMIGIVFLSGSAYCIFDLLTYGFKSYTITGLFLFTLIGTAFIKKARSR